MATAEKTVMQALERAYPDLALKSGQERGIDYEYIRNGPQCLIANFDVARGQIVAPFVGPTRKEEDFATPLEKTIDTDPEASWIFITDQLDTHKAESLVHLAASQCGIQGNLAVTGKCSILKSMPSRSEFQQEPNHRIRFIYTREHTSGLNQVQIWFSILVRRLPNRSSFKPTEELRKWILAIIGYFTEHWLSPSNVLIPSVRL